MWAAKPKRWKIQRDDSPVESGWAIQVSPCSGGKKGLRQAVQRVWLLMVEKAVQDGHPLREGDSWGRSVPSSHGSP